METTPPAQPGKPSTEPGSRAVGALKDDGLVGLQELPKEEQDTAPAPENSTETRRNRFRKVMDNIHIRQGVSLAWEKVTGRIPSPEQLGRLKDNLGSRMAGTKIMGQDAGDFFWGFVTGGVTREAAKLGFTIAGVGGLPMAVGVGAAVGGTKAGVREYLRQRKEGIKIEEDIDTVGIRTKLKNEFRRIKAADRTKVRNAAARGAVMGAIGGLVGGVVMDFISERINLEELGKNVGQGIGERAQVGIQNLREAGGTLGQGIQEDLGPVLKNTQWLGEGIKAETTATAEIIKEKAGEIGENTPLGQIGENIRKIIPDQELNETLPSDSSGKLTPLDKTPEQVLTPKGVESITLDAGSNPWRETQKYLTDQLGKTPSNEQIQEAVTRLLNENNISDATKIPAGTAFNIASVNEYIGQILAEQQQIPVDLASSPETVFLSNGSNLWNETSEYLEDVLGRKATDAEILQVTKEVCRQSDIAVPNWEIRGANLHTKLPTGYQLVFNQPVKKIIGKLAA